MKTTGHPTGVNLPSGGGVPGYDPPVLLLLVSIAFFLSTSALAQLDNSDCLDCHGDQTLTKTDSSGKEVSVFVDESKITASVHGTNTCVSCHVDIKSTHPDDERVPQPVNCGPCHAADVESYNLSVHGLALQAGNSNTATCASCHGTHLILSPNSAGSPLHFSRLATTCGTCHEAAARDVSVSVHGKSVAAGHREAATCTDCHSGHQTERLRGATTMHIANDVCSKCHASERLNTKFKMPADRVKSFFESYHGLAARYGSTVAANCGSCHGFHKILPQSHPESAIHKTRLVETCGKCHPGASEKFAQGTVHVDAARAGGGLGDKVNWWVRRIYLVLILGVIGGMILHNGILFLRKIAAVRRREPRTVMRMNKSQRVQHLLLLTSFIALAVTGFALKFPDSWMAFGSSESLRQWTHRIAGVVLIAVGIFHIGYAIFCAEGRRFVRDMMPCRKDAADVLVQFRYLAGLSKNKVQFGRFGYVEKMEYWAVVWGTVIMGITGLMIWLKIDVTRFLPRWAIDVATTVHYYEAILACLAVIVWHFYHVIFDPDVYPVNPAWLDGKVSPEWQKHEHPLESVPLDCPKNGKSMATEVQQEKAPPSILSSVK